MSSRKVCTGSGESNQASDDSTMTPPQNSVVTFGWLSGGFRVVLSASHTSVTARRMPTVFVAVEAESASNLWSKADSRAAVAALVRVSRAMGSSWRRIFHAQTTASDSRGFRWYSFARTVRIWRILW